MTILLLALIGCGIRAEAPVYTGVVEVTEVAVSAAIPGRLVTVQAREGDKVKAGQTLFTVEPDAFEVQRDLRAAGVVQAQAAVQAASAQQGAATAQIRFLNRELDRVSGLAAAGVGTDQQVSTLQGQLDVARAQRNSASKGIDTAQAAVQLAEQGVRAAEERLAQTTVLAPIDGTVLSRVHEPGEVIGPGLSVVTLGDLTQPTLRVYVPLVKMETLSLGQAASVTLDAFPDTPTKAHITHIASQAEFTPRDILTPEERVKRVFAVELAIDATQGLHPGVPAEVIFND